ncbi:fimbrial protein FimV [Shewanella putrefaciens]|uniref:FimV/HubP family polar landmark protein n=1 Tax=Shewanella putrefaciens TaxID=24 RepID=UPI0021BFD419|nr:FimV/HubP family polar landmark protein [Shewanella putrefaciens]UXK08192.1 fimbrial protein FimV [Shewanella putrefaciens]
MANIVKSLGLFILVCSASSMAQVSHVSINNMMFELGTYPKMRLNVITDNQDITRLEFVLRQSSGEEKLMAQELNRFLVLLTGVEDVKDPKAQLVVREYRVDRWYEVKKIPLFVELSAVASHTTSVDSTRISQGVKSAELSSEVRLNKVDIVATEAKSLPAVSSSNLTPITKSMGSESIVTTGFIFSKDEPDQETGNAPKMMPTKECLLNYDSSETLWRVANRYANEWNVSVYGAMLAIYDANPKAFAKNKISALRGDAALYCPSTDLLAQYPDAEEAKAIFEAKQAVK